MGSSKLRGRKSSNPDLRRQTQIAAPAIEEIEKILLSWLEPEMFTPLRLIRGKNDKMLRDRLLNLPVMMAVILSLVYLGKNFEKIWSSQPESMVKAINLIN